MKRLRRAPMPASVRWFPLAFRLGLVAAAVALLAGRAMAQDTERGAEFALMGTVSGENGQPLVGAFVSEEGSKWGSLTDEKGRFRIPDMTSGRVALVVEQLGYDTLRWAGEVKSGEAVALTLAPKPVLLEGLNVVTDRFQRRRNATATTVRAFDRSILATSPQPSLLEFIYTRGGVTRAGCAGLSRPCFWVRGRPTQARVYIDEAPVLGGTDYLAAISPYELYMVEIYGNGRQIRVYTNRFMERAAKIRMQPIAFVF